MQKLIILSICLLSTFDFIYSQTPKREKYLTAGFNIGTIGWSPTHLNTENSYHLSRTMNFGASVVRDENGNKIPAIIANTSLGIHAGFMWKDKKRNNLTGLQFEFQKNQACYSFKQPFDYTYKGERTGGWVDADSYFKYSLSLMRTWYLFSEYKNDNDFWYTKMSFGQTFYHRNFGINYDLHHQENWVENGTGMTLEVVSANAKSYMLSPEIGHKFLLANDNMLDIGLVSHLPFNTTRVVAYEFFIQGTPMGKSQITYTGATIMLNVAYTFVHKIKPKSIDSTRLKSYQDLAEIDSTEIKHQDVTFHHHKINGRRFTVQESLRVSSSVVTLSVWDKNRVDGDEISLYLNGEVILENYIVSKTKEEIVLNLKPGSNIIVMHALNLGRVPPNTAALSIDDGTKKKKMITLVSDLKKSGAVEIIYNP